MLIYWFRNDLRLHDNPSLVAALARGHPVLPVYVDEDASARVTAWGFARVGTHRRRFLVDTLRALDTALRVRGTQLTLLRGAPQQVLPALARAINASTIACETIPAPEEIAAVAALRASGLTVHETWQSTLLPLEALPFDALKTPDVFTAFRQQVERAGVRPDAPIDAPERLPASPLIPDDAITGSIAWLDTLAADETPSLPDARLPDEAPPSGGEAAALAHLHQYFSRPLAHTYKATRDALQGADHSTRLSPWLATGALSPRRAFAALRAFEAQHGANESTYWIWFELLWRDHFRLLHRKYGHLLYRRWGLRGHAPKASSGPQRARAPNQPISTTSLPRSDALSRWIEGRTGEPLVDAGMRELQATGWLSNRMRQMVASFLVHDLQGDWRAGAAWFESQLVDFDVCSNQGNWLYIAGLGTDPRGGRRFDPIRQARTHDPDGAYRRRWSTA